MKIFAYVRISTKQQDTENQKFEILKYVDKLGVVVNKWVNETVSGKKSYKERELGNLIKEIQKGDSLIVTELSRLGRSLLEVMEILNQLLEREVKIHIVKSNMELGKNIQSKVLAFAFSLAAEIERDLISSRTIESLGRLKSEGVILGRPKGSIGKSKLDGKEKDISTFLEKKVSVTSICRIMDVTPPTFYNFCRSRNINIRPEILHKAIANNV